MSDLSIHQTMASLKDVNALGEKTKRSASHEQLVKAAKEFEAVFMDIVTKSMRSTVQKSDVFGDSEKTDMFQSMLDTEYSKLSSNRQQTGLAAAIVKQLEPRFESEQKAKAEAANILTGDLK